ncbi:MAG: hypothetical protein II393_03635 [Cytophagales bacterium]|nr:hypothetical protein [Cytophagales bacterium]
MMKQNSKNSQGFSKMYVANLTLIVIIASCAWYELFMRYHVTNTGLQYRIINIGSKEDNSQNDARKQYFTIERSISYSGKVLEYPNQYGERPFIYDYKNHIFYVRFNGKYEEALGMLQNKDDEIQVRIRAKDIPYEYGLPELDVKPNRYVVVRLKLVEHIDRNELKDIFDRYRKERQKDVDERTKVEVKNIESYLEKKKYSVSAQKNNIYFVETEAGDGNKINIGDEVEINYYFQHYNGNVLQTNIEEIAMKNKLKKRQTIKIPVRNDEKDWLSFALLNMSNNAKGYVFFPSVSLYNIDPSSDFWIFYLEVVGVTTKEELEKKRELEKQEELKRKEEKKKQEELKKQEEMKKSDATTKTDQSESQQSLQEDEESLYEDEAYKTKEKN